MVKCNNYSAIDILFPFLALSINWATGFSASLRLTEVHTMYLQLVNALLFKRDRVKFSERKISQVADSIPELKKCAVQIFGTVEEVSLFRLKFHILGHVCKDVSQF